MKKNYNIGDQVQIVKPGMFEGLSGSVLSNNTETIFKPLSVILDKGLGIWQFSYSDVEPIGKEKIKVDHRISEPEADNKIDNLQVVTKSVKRAYNKRSKDQPVKEKRKYTRRIAK